MEKIRIGFAGVGLHATESIYPCLRYAPIELVATCARHIENAQRNARLFGAEHAYDDFEKMIGKEDLDAVFIIGPPKMHFELTKIALNNGLHVFIEKPPADTFEETKTLFQLSQQAGKHVMVAFMKRFATAYRRVKEIMTLPEFGKPTMIEIKFAHWPNPDLHTTLINMDLHIFDLLRFFIGDVKILHIESNLDGQFSLAVSLKFKNGAVGLLYLSDQQQGLQESVQITGQSAFIMVDNVIDLRYRFGEKQEVVPLGRIPEPAGILRFGEFHSWRPDLPMPGVVENTLSLRGYLGEVQEFAEALLARRTPSPSIRDGVEAMRIAAAIERNTSGTVNLDEI